MNGRGKSEICQTSVAVVTDKNSGLVKGYWGGPNRPDENIYPIQVPVYDVVRVKIVETFGHIQYLGRITLSVKAMTREDSPG